jgi:pimeloyl-ACP methyl ester carboxylesterase
MTQGLGPPAQSMTLRDGRTVSWYEFGDRAGVPCIYIPGTPESGLAGGCYDESARAAGVRWISVDKPGYGHSDPLPGRRLTDWPADVSQLADRLALTRFAVAGESGGGPHALATAAALGDRVALVALLASAGVPLSGRTPRGLTPLNALLYGCARVDRRLVRAAFAGIAFAMRHEASMPWLVGLLGRGVPEVDLRAMTEPAYEARLAAGPDAFTQGSRWTAEEFLMLRSPWHLDLSTIAAPIHQWHGARDRHVPLPVARALCHQLPNVAAHIDDDAAHTVGFTHRDAVMAVLLAALRPDQPD